MKNSTCLNGSVQAEVWNVDVAAKSSEYTDVQLSANDERPGRRVITEHIKVVNSSQLLPLMICCFLLNSDCHCSVTFV